MWECCSEGGHLETITRRFDLRHVRLCEPDNRGRKYIEQTKRIALH